MKHLLCFYICLIVNTGYAQESKALLCAEDAGNRNVQAGLYVLIPTKGTELKGMSDPVRNEFYCLEKNSRMSLRDMDSIYISYDKVTEFHRLNIRFNETGSRELEAFTGAHVQQKVGFFVHGKLLNAAVVMEKIGGGSLSIDGLYSESELLTMKHELEEAVRK